MTPIPHIIPLAFQNLRKCRSRDTSRIEHLLDGLLGYCYENSMVALFRVLCRYYFTFNPQAAVEYVHANRDLWDSPAEADDE